MDLSNDAPGAPDRDRLERTLAELPEVFDCACCVTVDIAGATRRVAYVVAGPGLDAGRVRAQLARVLPDTSNVDVCFVSSLPPRQASGFEPPDALPILDAPLVAQAESLLQAACAGDAVVGVTRARREPPLLHLDDVYRAPAAEHSDEPATADAAAVGRAADVPAVSHTPALSADPAIPGTVDALLVRAADQAPSRGVGFLDGRPDLERLTYPELLHYAQRLAGGLVAAGVQSRGHVILQLPEPVQFIPSFFGALLGGAVAVPMAAPPVYQADNPQAESLAFACRMLGQATVVVPEARTQELRGFLARVGVEATVLAQETLAAEVPRTEPAEWEPDDVAVMLMTSGSTGQPKGVPLRHRNIIDCMRATAVASHMDADDVVLNWLPLDHPGPLIRTAIRPVLVLAEQLHGTPATVIQNPLKWLDWIDAHHVTNAWAPNFAFSLLRDRASEIRAGQWDLSRVQCLLNTAEPIVVETCRDVLALLQPFGLRPEAMAASWGMAETSSGVTQNSRFLVDQGGHQGDKFADLGPPIAGVEVRIVDAADQVLREREIGHIQVRGATVTEGYYRDPERNAESFSADGWFKTGDLGCLHEGRLTITGRSKDVIIVAGRNLYSHEVESAAEVVDGIEPSFSAACGIRPPGAETDMLAVFVHVQPSHDLAHVLADVRSSVTRRTGVTPRWVLPVEKGDIPKTSIGKIQRPKLKARFEAGEFSELARKSDLLLRNEGTLPNWFYEKRWQAWHGTDSGLLPKGTWLWIDRGGDIANDLATRLPAEAKVVHVVPGDGYVPASAGVARVRTHSVDDFEVLLGDVAPDHIVCALAHDEEPGRGATLGFDAAMAEGPDAALCLLAALARRADAGATPPGGSLWLVASHATALDDEVPVPSRAALPALAKCAVRELPNLDVRFVDVDPGPPTVVVDALRQESQLLRGDRDVAYRAGVRHVPRLVPLDFPPSTPPGPPVLERGGRYVLSGGLGGIGYTIASHLLRHYEARLLLLGRAPLEAGSERAAHLQSLQRLSGTVEYAAVDLLEGVGVGEAFAGFEARSGGPVQGILHLAGSAPDRPLVAETTESLRACIDPKGPGALVLSDLRPDALFVSFSSLMGFFGGATMGAYCAANMIAESVVQELRRRGRRAYCLASSTWEDTGVSRGHSGAAVRAQGHYAMAPRQAVASLMLMLEREVPVLSIGLDGENVHVAPWTCSTPRNVEVLVGLCEGEQVLDPPSLTDRYGTPVPLSLRAVDRLPRTDAGEIDRDLAVRIAAGRGSRAPKNDTERRMLSVWAQVLGGDVDLTDNFFELGGDSVKALSLLAAIEREFGVSLSQAAVFEAPTAEALAALLTGDGETGDRAESPIGVVVIRAAQGSSSGDVYFVHDADGNLLLYRGLAENLPEDMRVLGLPPPTDAEGRPMYTRVREMAIWFADRILDTHAGGKLVVGGLCAGGALAFETAAELESRGYEVGQVVLLDAAHPHAVRMAAAVHRGRVDRLKALWGDRSVEGALLETARRGARALRYEARAKLGGQRSGDRIQRLRFARDTRGPIPDDAREIGTRELYQFAKQGFEPRSVRAPVLLLRATARRAPDGPGFSDEPVRELCDDPVFGWGPLCAGPLEAHDVPGGHSTMLQAPSLEVSANLVASAIRAVRPGKAPVIDGRHVAVVIVNYRTPDLTLDCLETLKAERAELTGFHVYVVEGASGDDSVDRIAAGIAARGYDDWVTLLPLDQNRGYAYGNNAGIQLALEADPELEMVHLLNPDTLVRRGAVRLLVQHLRDHPEVGAAASCLEDRPGRRRTTRFRFPTVFRELDRGMRTKALRYLLGSRVEHDVGLPPEPVPVEWAPGASLMVDRRVLDEVGPLDDGFFLYYEETEFLLRAARAGWRCDFVPASRVVHLIGQSTGVTTPNQAPKRPPDYVFESRRRYFEKSHGVVYAELANLAFAGGTVVGLMRETLQRRPPRPDLELRGVLEHSRVLGPLLRGKPGR